MEGTTGKVSKFPFISSCLIWILPPFLHDCRWAVSRWALHPSHFFGRFRISMLYHKERWSLNSVEDRSVPSTYRGQEVIHTPDSDALSMALDRGRGEYWLLLSITLSSCCSFFSTISALHFLIISLWLLMPSLILFLIDPTKWWVPDLDVWCDRDIVVEGLPIVMPPFFTGVTRRIRSGCCFPNNDGRNRSEMVLSKGMNVSLSTFSTLCR